MKFHQQLINFYQNRIPELKKEIFERQKQTDNVVVWTAGLSTGSIALILSGSRTEPIIDILFFKFAMIFFLFSIVTAVLYRTFIYKLQDKESNVIFGFEGYCYGASCKVYGPIEILDSYTIEDIAKSLKNDMDLDYDDWLKNKNLDRDFWVEHYKRWAIFWVEQEREGLRNLSKALAPIIGKVPEDVNEETFTKENDINNQVKNLNRLRKICFYSNIGVMLFFLFGLFTITLGFIFK